ncbi:MAG TPA: DUF2306 domain-containing protein [Rhizomicrobium sp.]
MRSWLPPLLLIGLGLGALGIALTNVLIPFPDQVASVATFSGKVYADEQLGNFEHFPLLIHAHAILGTVFVLIAALQFWPRFRNSYRRAHRILGYVALACLVILPISGVVSAIVYPFAGFAGVIPNIVWMTAILFCVAMAWSAIRRRDIVQHEAWVLRATAMTIGITLSRLYVPLLVPVLGMEPHRALALVFWMGQGEGLLIAELWLRRPGGPLARRLARAAA